MTLRATLARLSPAADHNGGKFLECVERIPGWRRRNRALPSGRLLLGRAGAIESCCFGVCARIEAAMQPKSRRTLIARIIMSPSVLLHAAKKRPRRKAAWSFEVKATEAKATTVPLNPLTRSNCQPLDSGHLTLLSGNHRFRGIRVRRCSCNRSPSHRPKWMLSIWLCKARHSRRRR